MTDSLIHSVAGATGGIVAMTATYPLVFLSTRAAVKVKSENKTTYEAVLEIIEREGVSGLYSGLSSSLLAIAVTNGVYYYFYERTRGLVLKSRVGSKGMSTLESMLTGLIAGSATAILSNPLWVIQTTQAVQTMDSWSQRVVKKLGFFQAIKNILAKSRVQGFWRGIGPALVLTVNPIIQYTVFEQLKNFLVSKRMARLRAAGTVVSATVVLSDFDFFVLGAISKLVATLTTYPYMWVYTLSINSLTYPYFHLALSRVGFKREAQNTSLLSMGSVRFSRRKESRDSGKVPVVNLSKAYLPLPFSSLHREEFIRLRKQL
ncbi:hypothetical protein E1B28_004381 [Marasmius oreades]|uniref:Uncharacterized protein n=1 Tax=Marasmius oreades TaxID=181124 RepID=A0A9P8ACP8_9AGAR|nr:uncharacterized protein E1B28_004381 [Marasmius oreades]KAG7096986.1 hypothetical protein E1B28_004381 [Marasmius oreades]